MEETRKPYKVWCLEWNQTEEKAITFYSETAEDAALGWLKYQQREDPMPSTWEIILAVLQEGKEKPQYILACCEVKPRYYTEKPHEIDLEELGVVS